MNTTNRTLDRLQAKYGITSDYGLAKLLNVTRGAVSSWRKGKSQMADEPAIHAAMLLNEDPGELLARLQEERAETPEVRATWNQIAARLRDSAALVVVATVSMIVANENSLENMAFISLMAMPSVDYSQLGLGYIMRDSIYISALVFIALFFQSKAYQLIKADCR